MAASGVPVLTVHVSSQLAQSPVEVESKEEIKLMSDSAVRRALKTRSLQFHPNTPIEKLRELLLSYESLKKANEAMPIPESPSSKWSETLQKMSEDEVLEALVKQEIDFDPSCSLSELKAALFEAEQKQAAIIRTPCPTCTFLNDSSVKTCEVCRSSMRPSDASPATTATTITTTAALTTAATTIATTSTTTTKATSSDEAPAITNFLAQLQADTLSGSIASDIQVEIQRIVQRKLVPRHPTCSQFTKVTISPGPQSKSWQELGSRNHPLQKLHEMLTNSGCVRLLSEKQKQSIITLLFSGTRGAIERGMNFDTDPKKETIAFDLAKKGAADKLSSLPSAQCEAYDKHYSTPLYYACQLGHVDVVQKLLEKGAVPEQSHFLDMLTVAIMRGHSAVALALIPHLLDDLNGMDSSGRRPLTSAIICKLEQVAWSLLDHGASPTLCASDQVAPIEHACRLGMKNVVAALLDKTSVSIEDFHLPALALQNGHEGLCLMLLNRVSSKLELSPRCDSDGVLLRAAIVGNHQKALQQLIGMRVVDLTFLHPYDFTLAIKIEADSLALAILQGCTHDEIAAFILQTFHEQKIEWRPSTRNTHTFELCVRQRMPRTISYMLANCRGDCEEAEFNNAIFRATKWCANNNRLKMLQFLLLQGVDADGAFRAYVALKEKLQRGVSYAISAADVQKAEALGKMLEETHVRWKKQIALLLLDHFYHDLVTLIVGYHHTATWSEGFELNPHSREERMQWQGAPEEDVLDFFHWIFDEQ